MTAALADTRQWPHLVFDPGLSVVLAGLERAADIERLIGNAEARADWWGGLWRRDWWGQIAQALEPIAPAVCALLPGVHYDPELPGFWEPGIREIRPAHALTLVRERIGAA